MRIVIVGAGMAGLACASALRGQGFDVRLVDKGRAAGGRMSTRRMPTPTGEAQFDHGAQYFSARDAAFQQQVASWCAAGVAAAWPAAGSHAWVGMPAMSALISHMADAHPVDWSTQVTQLEPLERSDRGWRLHFAASATGAARAPIEADAVILAIPVEQVATLLAGVAPDIAAEARAVCSAPNWTAMLAFAQPVPVEQDCWRSDDAIAWATRNSAKPGRSGPESWVVQASIDWSRAHLEETPEQVLAALSLELAALLGVTLPAVSGAAAHRWRYALPGAPDVRGVSQGSASGLSVGAGSGSGSGSGSAISTSTVTGTVTVAGTVTGRGRGTGTGTGTGTGVGAGAGLSPGPGFRGESAIFDATRGLGVCGDWLVGPRVEGAWLSGVRLASLMVATGLAGALPAGPEGVFADVATEVDTSAEKRG